MADAMDLEASLALEYDGISLPPFTRGTFDEAINHATRISRFLVVYLHNPNHEATDAFVANVLASKALAAIEDRMLLYGVDVTSSSGFSLGLKLKCTTYPYLAVFFKKQVVSVLQGPALAMAPNIAVDALTQGMDNWDFLMAKEMTYRLERESREAARIHEESTEAARMQRDKELLEAFEAKEAARKKAEQEAQEREDTLRREQQERAKEDERRQREEEAAAKAAHEALMLEKSLALSRVPEAPADDADPATVLCVSIRFPKRAVERKFALTDDVEGLYSFVEANDEYSGRKVTLMLSGMPPTPIERTSGTSLSSVVGGQRRVAIIVREW